MTAAPQSSPSPAPAPPVLAAILALIGFTATIAQIVLMRELMVVFNGNEISLGMMLGCWLLWTAIGSGVLGRFAVRAQDSRKLVAFLQVLLAFLAPATILAIRTSRSLFHAVPGELLGPSQTLVTCLLALSAFCAVIGCIFVAGSRLRASEPGVVAAVAVNSVYLLEAVGSAVGGVLASLVLLRSLNSLQIAFLLSALNVAAAGALLLRKRGHAMVAVSALLAAWAFAGVPSGSRLEAASIAHLWPGSRVIDTRNSVYGNLTVVETPGIRSLLENGLLMFSAPDLLTAEENVHFALLEQPAPKSLLLIGGGAGGSLLQALQHRALQRIDYVELDPTVLELAEHAFAEQWSVARADPRVHVHHADGRFFLKSTEQRFDVIIVALPAPQTAQLNRFYTADFFREAAAKLTPRGVFSFQLHAAEEYIAPELGALLRCVRKSLQEVFPAVRIIPGETVHFVAAQTSGVLAGDINELLARLRSRDLKTTYVREYYLPFRMAPDRVRDLELMTQPRPDTPVNRDLAPIAYYFDVALWGTQFNREYLRVFEFVARTRFKWLAVGTAVLLLIIAIAIRCVRRPAGRLRWTVGYCIAASGLTMISLEVMLLLGFQAIYGYVYHRLALLIGLFMAGMAMGNWLRSRTAQRLQHVTIRTNTLRVAGLQICAALAPLLLYALLATLAGVGSLNVLTVASQIIFPLMALLAGALGGYEFAVATELFLADREASQPSMGMLYGVDLMGACLGTLVASVFLLPLFGFFKTARLIALVNLIPAMLALSVARSGLGGGGQQSAAFLTPQR